MLSRCFRQASKTERRDREAKLKLYSRRGAHEYWIIEARMRSLEVHRRDQAQLKLVNTLFETDFPDYTPARRLLTNSRHLVRGNPSGYVSAIDLPPKEPSVEFRKCGLPRPSQ
ncbi:MAG TPA: Uma2 family endonuclease [Blastocatellia bacterium]|nr:Uma2 family endonuclease [Blastocatellia bacterium]